MPRNSIKNETHDIDIKLSLDKIIDKQSEGNIGGVSNNMFVNLAQQKANQLSN